MRLIKEHEEIIVKRETLDTVRKWKTIFGIKFDNKIEYREHEKNA